MEISLYLGWIFCFSALLFFGLFTFPVKLKSVVKANVDPIFFQVAMSFSILISAFYALFLNLFEEDSSFKWSWYGAGGGSVWIIASILSIIGIRNLGIGISQSLWSGGTMIGSFLYGYFLFNEQIKNIYLTILALALLIIGIIGISFADININFFNKKKQSDNDDYIIIEEEPNENNEEEEERHEINEKSSMIKPKKEKKEEKRKKKNFLHYLIGFIAIFAMIFFNSSIMIFAKFDEGNILYLFSFGVTQFICITVIFTFYFIIQFLIQKKSVITYPQLRPGIMAGLMSGFFWGVANYAQTFTVFSPLGLTIGFPLVQLSLLVASLIGMIFMGELKGIRKKIHFFLFLFVFIFPGFFLLSFFG